MSAGIEVSMTHSSRTYFSATYSDSAARAARGAYAIEVIEKDRFRFDEHKQFVVTAVIMSAAAIEAAINEICCDAIDGYSNSDEPVSSDSKKDLSLLWTGPDNLERQSAIEKYKTVIRICGGDHERHQFANFTRQTQWADVKRLLDLRNLLMHYRPLTIRGDDDGGEKDIKRVRDHLQSKIAENKLTGEGNSFYPHKLLGHGCAEWSVQTSAYLLKWFGDAMKLHSAYFYMGLKDEFPRTQV
ncbi:hypothetical protein EKL30_16975 [Candidimonas sp. SYP-B2681]|uniref:hypothetical protein n=1 Tax=Candidimonas sp. SYP-B2681 TaxID=2497686 RepID=UPI000F86C356|nr:hypothetical protein [Candidimonas sp. SYP-B2681]RTZ39951.1 hypothetical protein EKL30_16975 [Candidimonas sp. SYP-B2681]